MWTIFYSIRFLDIHNKNSKKKCEKFEIKFLAEWNQTYLVEIYQWMTKIEKSLEVLFKFSQNSHGMKILLYILKIIQCQSKFEFHFMSDWNTFLLRHSRAFNSIYWQVVLPSQDFLDRTYPVLTYVFLSH